MIDFDATLTALRTSVFDGPAAIKRELRQAIAARAASAPGEGPELPTPLRAYVDKLAHAAYKIGDEDLEALRAAGHDEHDIYEISIAAAFSAGVARYEAGMRALRGEPR